ncbi:serine carboxypeptidase, putative [Ricinus communis]|uniref:Serine carboxypeptidase, putative n=1 Tax=Ricinus communis TaxID=3988 RepID=B9S814_RICCO|nr:serine carboxypeptidase, putative [Ricinus communis]
MVVVLAIEPSFDCASKCCFLSGQTVKNLPGFDDGLPFKLETGYSDSHNYCSVFSLSRFVDSLILSYFTKSQGNPEEDPLFLWLTGGPACFSFHGLIYETGPMEFDKDNRGSYLVMDDNHN